MSSKKAKPVKMEDTIEEVSERAQEVDNVHADAEGEKPGSDTFPLEFDSQSLERFRAIFRDVVLKSAGSK